MNKPYLKPHIIIDIIYIIPGDIPYNFIAYRMVSHKNTYSMPRRLALGGRAAASVEPSLLRRGEPRRMVPRIPERPWSSGLDDVCETTPKKM